MTPAKMAALHATAFTNTRAWSETEFTTLLGQENIILRGDTRSFLLIRATADEAELLTLATDPSYQRQGLAKAILAQGEVDAANAGAAKMFLEVAENNMAARSLYDATGYVQVGRRPKYYRSKDETSIDALVLSKQLTSV